ncbi:hypothetical protein D3C74_153820 [compost metagenome]
MLHKENPAYNRGQVGFYSLDELFPKDYLLRQIEETIDCSSKSLLSNAYSAFAPCVRLSRKLKSIMLTAGFWG